MNDPNADLFRVAATVASSDRWGLLRGMYQYFATMRIAGKFGNRPNSSTGHVFPVS
jgi:hypothetical protein